MFVTYAGDCCYYESITEQDAHIGRIVKWLNDGLELSVLPFDLSKGQGSDILITVGKCCHQDLFESAMSQSTSVFCNLTGVAGGFCVKSVGKMNVVHTRDSHDFPGSNTGVVNIHRLNSIFQLQKIYREFNLSANQKARKANSPLCNKPILTFVDQLAKLEKWREAYEKWDYSSKGGFPEIPRNILELAEASPKLDGLRPVVEINFYLSTIQEHLGFVFRVLCKRRSNSERWIGVVGEISQSCRSRYRSL